MIVWILFIIGIIILLALDLGVFNKNPHVISSKEAGVWTAVWVTLSLAFSGIVYWLYSNGNYLANPDGLVPRDATIKYITGYLIELSLSIDNIFVIAIIFASFRIPQKYQHRVLFWGILGAIVFRGLMIFLGVMLIHKFSWMTYVFGVFLVFTAIKMMFTEDDNNFHPKNSFVFKMLRKVMPITAFIDNERFFVKRRHLTVATPLFVALVVIEVMDVVFAIDSVPAILSITSDPFLVFSSNIFAVLGLRSMYFFLANMLERFSYLQYSLIAILMFVGVKMLIMHYYKFPEWVSLSFIGLALSVGIIVSLIKTKKHQEVSL